MRIAVLISDMTGINGIARHMLLLSHEYAARGHTVDVWATAYDRLRCYPELVNGFRVRALRATHRPDRLDRLPRGLRIGGYLWRLRQDMRDQRALSDRLPGGYDVLHPHGYSTSWAAARYKRRHGTPIVWLCNDFWPVAQAQPAGSTRLADHLAHGARAAVLAPLARYDREAVSEIDRITVMSKRVQAEIRQHYGVSPILVRTGVDPARFAEGDRAAIRARHGLPESAFVVITVGILMPRRRLEDVIHAVSGAIRQGHDVRYLIAGRTAANPTYSAQIANLIARLGLEGRVLLVGEVSNDDLPGYYHAADAFAWVADESQSWGRAATEAMAAGTPAIVSTANGLSEVLEDGITALLVPPRDPDAIAGAIVHLHRDPAAAAAIGRAGQQLIQDDYSWSKEADTMLNLFAEVTGLRP